MSIRDHIKKLRGGDAETPRAVVAAFGKHPGWDDHISDIGLNTDALSACKTWLYVEGIRSLLDDGAWDELSEEERLDGYDHVFLQRVPEKGSKSRLGIGRSGSAEKGWLLGRMWSSTDGKGRARYPMVVCVHVIGVELDWMLGEPMHAVESLRDKCRATKTAEDVRNAVKAEELHLQNRLKNHAGRDSGEAGGTNVYAELAEQPALGPERQGMYRLMYQIDRDMSAYRPAGSGSAAGKAGTGSTAPAARHLRVPAGENITMPGSTARNQTPSSDAVAGTLSRWMRLMNAELAAGAPVLVFVPLESAEAGRSLAGWVDIVVGNPAAMHLKCLRCRPRHMPLVTDVPYQIEPEFIERIDALAAAPSISASEPDSKTVPPDVGKPQHVDSPSVGDSSGRATAAQSGRSQPPKLDPRLLRIGGGVAAVLLLILLLAVFVVRGGDQVPTELREAYATMRENWAEDLLAAAARHEPANDRAVAHRAQIERYITLHGGDASIMRELDRLSQQLSADGNRHALLRAEAYDETEKIEAAIAELRAVRDAMVDLLAAPRRIAHDLETSRGWNAAAGEVRSLADEAERIFTASRPVGSHGRGSDSAARDGSISALLAAVADATDTVNAVDPHWRALQDRREQVHTWAERHQEDIARRFSPSVDHALADARLDDLSEVVETWTHAADRLIEAAEQWAEVDVAHLHASGSVYEDFIAESDEAVPSERFIAWSEAAEDPAYALLPESDDPRKRRHDELRRWHDLLHENLTGYQRICGEVEFAGDRSAEVARSAGDMFDHAVTELDAMTWDRTRASRDIITERIDEIGRKVAEQNRELVTAMSRCEDECEQRLADVVAEGLPESPDATQAAIEHLVIDEWREIVSKADEAGSRCLNLLEAAGNITIFIERLNQRIDAAGARMAQIEAVPTGSDSAEFAEVMQANWHRRISAAIEQTQSIDWSRGIDEQHPLWDDLDRGVERHAQWAQQAVELLTDFRTIERGLKQARRWSDDRLEGRFSRWRETELLEELASHLPHIAKMAEAAHFLWWIEEADDGRHGEAFEPLEPIDLVAIVTDEAREPAHRWAAWRRLDEHVADPMYLAWERTVADPLRSMLGALDQPRGDELRAQYENARQARWLSHAEAARSQQALDEAFDAMDEFGISPEDLSDRQQLNWQVRELRELVRHHSDAKSSEASSADQHRIEQLARSIEPQLDAMGDRSDGQLEQVQAIETGLRAIIDFEPDEALKAGRGWSELALARAGWRPEASEDDSIVRFYPPDSWTAAHPELLVGSRPLRFRRVLDEEDSAMYVAETTMPVGLVIATIEERGEWPIFRRLMDRRMHGDDGADLRRGPRVWNWRAATDPESDMVISQGWIRSERAACYPENELPEPPSPDHPMQYISAGGAAYVSLLLGCRLMTEAEWRAAFEMNGGLGALEKANLRDRIWLDYAAHADTVHNCDAPDRGAFMPRHRVRELDRDVAWEHSKEGGGRAVHDDGVLWFRPVTSASADGPFSEIVGNTWELIFPKPELWREMTPESLPERLERLLDQQGGEGKPLLRAIGGSASSHPELGVDEAIAVESAVLRAEDAWTAAFSDVGFRLAFSVSADEFGMDADRQFRRMLAEQVSQFVYVLATGSEE